MHACPKLIKTLAMCTFWHRFHVTGAQTNCHYKWLPLYLNVPDEAFVRNGSFQRLINLIYENIKYAL